MFTTDHFDGSFEGWETELTQQPDGTWKASGLGVEVTHADREQALNDLNEKVFDGISKGEITPSMGN